MYIGLMFLSSFEDVLLGVIEKEPQSCPAFPKRLPPPKFMIETETKMPPQAPGAVAEAERVAEDVRGSLCRHPPLGFRPPGGVKVLPVQQILRP